MTLVTQIGPAICTHLSLQAYFLNPFAIKEIIQIRKLWLTPSPPLLHPQPSPCPGLNSRVKKEEGEGRKCF